jgi:hypothetical protein
VPYRKPSVRKVLQPTVPAFLLLQLRLWSWMAKLLEMAMAGNEKLFSAAGEGKEIDIELC